MRIKKLTAVAMTGMMVLGMGTSVCAATPITPSKGTGTKDVQATYTTDEKAETVYNVEIAWGDMQYTYKIASEGNWNPVTHQYDSASSGEWSCAEGANQVTVTNHSNAEVKATFTYEAKSDYESINGTFNHSEKTLETAEGTEPSSAPEGTSMLSLSGALDKNVTNPTTIGTATVTLSEAN